MLCFSSSRKTATADPQQRDECKHKMQLRRLPGRKGRFNKRRGGAVNRPDDSLISLQDIMFPQHANTHTQKNPITARLGRQADRNRVLLLMPVFVRETGVSYRFTETEYQKKKKKESLSAAYHYIFTFHRAQQVGCRHHSERLKGWFSPGCREEKTELQVQ